MQLASLRLGDSISGASSWGGAVRFGGAQWATNFSLQPGFVTFPLPGISGEAALPSTVDLYVDSALRMRRQVPSGPFSIQDLPVPSGRGDARLVVRDILGREQIITQPFDTNSRLLKQGLHDYSYELGFVRRDFGIDSNNYGRPMASRHAPLGSSPSSSPARLMVSFSQSANHGARRRHDVACSWRSIWFLRCEP